MLCECHILLLQSHTEDPHTAAQRGHSFEGLVSMAGVAVVRGALQGPNGAVGTVNTSQQHRREDIEDTWE